MNLPNGYDRPEQPQRRSYRVWIALFGSLIVIGGFATELLSYSPGYGPYQIWIIVVGLTILSMGVVKPDTKLFSVALVTLSIIFTLVPLEVAAKIYLKVNPVASVWWHDYTIEDDVLRLRLRPNSFDHDANGWRNPLALEQAGIVVIGDSETWGSNAKRDEAWPLVLAQHVDTSVYSMALPGYGPADYYTLLSQEALQLSPDMVIIGLYFGNDFPDAMMMTYSRDAYTSWRDDTLDKDVLLASYDEIVQITNDEREVWLPTVKHTPTLAETTNLGRLLYRFNMLPDSSSQVSQEALYNALPSDDPHRLDVYVDASQKIYFFPGIRAATINPNSLAVQEGDRLTRAFLQEMNGVCETNAIELVVVFIPTVELIYAPLVEEQHNRLSDAYEDLVTYENNSRMAYQTFLAEQEIPVIDGLVPLQAAANTGQHIYPPFDAHPNALGYQILGEYVATELQHINDRD